MKRKNSYDVVGLMSGSSCDGIDLALCRFNRFGDQWQYRILRAETLPYTAEWNGRLNRAASIGAQDFIRLHSEYGRFLGHSVKKFLGEGPDPDLIASHGHTIFHSPATGLTFQLGDGAGIAAVAGCTTVSDFRRLDVEFGGQGAPLVPVGDELLFGAFDACLNLGGFANISFRKDGTRVAFDICPVNIILNYLAAEKGLGYDDNGRLGRAGRIHEDLVRQLNDLPYYREKGPKSLGREWLESEFMPLVNRSGLPLAERLRSVYAHVAHQIGLTLGHLGEGSKVLVTGGGAFNAFLVDLLQRSPVQLIVPEPGLVRFKEALIFGLLGLLRYRGEVNCLASVTGGSRDLKAGVIHIV